jgi:signal transduction histidine kinase
MNLDDLHANREAGARRELYAVLAHEFRSPIGAILGFEELLREGIFGEVPDAGREALARVRASARQLLDLVAGLSDLAAPGADEQLLQSTSTRATELIAAALEAIEQDAAGRGTTVELGGSDELPAIDTDPDRAERALRLALMAGVKSTPGGTIVVRPTAAPDALLVDIEGTRLDARRDDPHLSLAEPEQPRLSGAGLRIAMARHALEPLNGRVEFTAAATGTTLRITLPRTTPAGRD